MPLKTSWSVVSCHNIRWLFSMPWRKQLRSSGLIHLQKIIKYSKMSGTEQSGSTWSGEFFISFLFIIESSLEEFSSLSHFGHRVLKICVTNLWGVNCFCSNNICGCKGLIILNDFLGNTLDNNAFSLLANFLLLVSISEGNWVPTRTIRLSGYFNKFDFIISLQKKYFWQPSVFKKQNNKICVALKMKISFNLTVIF